MSTAKATIEIINRSVELLAPTAVSSVEALLNAELWPCFDEAVLNFCEVFSAALLADDHARQQSDVVAFAYWLRPAQIMQIREEFNETSIKRRAHGMALHIAPGNVDTVFVYSMMLSLLLGNRNIVRVSNSAGAVAGAIINVLNKILTEPQNETIANRLWVIRYPRDDRLTQMLSELCQLRVIWGGDKTIEHITQLPLHNSCVDVCFPNRYSAALLEAQAVIEQSDLAWVTLFYRDAAAFGQQACSSPRTIYWLGEKQQIEKAKRIFWAQYHDLLAMEDNQLSDAECYQRELFQQRVALEKGSAVTIVCEKNVVRNRCDYVGERLERSHCGLQYFFEIDLQSIEELQAHVGPHYQTLTVYGVDRGVVLRAMPPDKKTYLKRLVAVGEALSFSHHWDGVNLVDRFTAHIGFNAS